MEHAASDENAAAAPTFEKNSKSPSTSLEPLRSVPNFSSPSSTSSSNSYATKQQQRATPRSRMKRSQSVQVTGIDRNAEQQRWNDVIVGREAHGFKSPLKIYPNPLRLFEPSKIQSLTGNKVEFDVVLEDPFLATPDRKQQRLLLNRQSSELSFATTGKKEISAAEAEADRISSEFGADENPQQQQQQQQQQHQQQQQRLEHSSSMDRLPTPRLTAGQEAALLFAPRLEQHQLLKSPSSSSSVGSSGSKRARRRGSGARRAGGGGSRSLASSSGLPGPRELEIPSGQRTPRWGSLAALLQWGCACGDSADRTVLALAGPALWKSRDVASTLQTLFVADTSDGRPFRMGALALVGAVLDVLPFAEGDEARDAPLARLEEFVAHTASMHAKMAAQRHTQAALYAAAPPLLARLRDARSRLARSAAERAARDTRLFYRANSSAPPVLREDAELVALALSAGLDESLLALSSLASFSSFLSVSDPRKLAAAMTQIDAAMFASLTGSALLHGARSGPAAVPSQLADGSRVVSINHLVTITTHWNTLSRWVPSAVLFYCKDKSQTEQQLAKGRAKLLRQFIELAAELRALENWSSFFAIVIGLGSSSLTCLKETWKLIPAKELAQMREMEEACQPISNFRIYRESIARCMESGTFCIPYMAIVLKDLQAVEEGNPNKNARGLFNFEKLQLFSAVMLKVRQMQAVSCPVKSVDKKVLLHVLNLPCKSETELWEKSRLLKEIEAKAAEEPLKRFPTFRRQ